ncbi:hypothetical protein HYZ64_01120 [Candidatus Berkelbacteria bacterium]|nr:hypothetical protein [Candidatus Berkelbacteria bacterium]
MIVGVVLVAVILGAVVLANRSKQRTEASGSQVVAEFKTEKEAAIAAAKGAYAKAKTEGKDLESGPCLGRVFPNWAADVVHEPREQIDNLKENQCKDFIEGTVKHFVELDPQGKVIRAL